MEITNGLDTPFQTTNEHNNLYLSFHSQHIAIQNICNYVYDDALTQKAITVSKELEPDH